MSDSELRGWLDDNYDRITIHQACAQTAGSLQELSAPDLAVFVCGEKGWSRLSKLQVNDMWSAHTRSRSFCHFISRDLLKLSAKEYADVKRNLESLHSERLAGIYKVKKTRAQSQEPFAVVLEFPPSSAVYRNLLIAGGSLLGAATVGGVMFKKSRDNKQASKGLAVLDEKREIATLDKYLTDKHADLARLDAEISSKANIVEEKQAQHDQILENISALNESLTEKHAALARLDAEISSRAKILEDEQAQILANRQNQISELDKLLQDKAAESARLVKQIEEQDNMTLTCGEKIREQLQVLDNLNAQVAQAEHDLQDAKNYLHDLAQEGLNRMAQLRDNTVQPESQHDDFPNVQEKDENIELLRRENVELRDKLQILNSDDSKVEANDELVFLRQKNAELDEKLQNVRIDKSKVKSYDEIKGILGLDSADDVKALIENYSTHAQDMGLNPSDLNLLIQRTESVMKILKIDSLEELEDLATHYRVAFNSEMSIEDFLFLITWFSMFDTAEIKAALNHPQEYKKWASEINNA